MYKPITQTLCSLLTLLFVLASVEARATSIIINGSFGNTNGTFVGDANKVDELNSGSSTIPGWTTINGVPTAWIENGNPWDISASNGSFFLDLTGYSDFGTYGGVSQSFTTTPGSNYAVTFDLGYGGNSAVFGGPVSVEATAGGFTGTFTSASGTPDPAVWDPETFTFMATSTTTDLRFIGLSTAGGDYIGLDNVDVEAAGVTGLTPVPEPGTFGLLLTGIGFLGGLRIVWPKG
jgi:hypothetical protein